MKLTQASPDHITSESSGVAQIIIGAFLLAVGIGVAIFTLVGHLQAGVYIFAGAFALFGILAIVFASSTSIVLVQNGTSSITNKCLIGGKTKTTEFANTDVAAVLFDSSIQYERQTTNGRTSTTRERVSNLSIILKDTSEIALDSDRRGMSTINGISLGRGASPLQEQGQQIAAFFGVQLVNHDQSLTPASLSEAVGEISNLIHGHDTSRPAETISPPALSYPAPVTGEVTAYPQQAPLTAANPTVAAPSRPLSGAPVSVPQRPTPTPESSPRPATDSTQPPSNPQA